MLFRRKPAVPTKPELDEAYADILKRLAKLEADTKQLKLEWEETFESMRRTLAKLARRDQREAASTAQDAPGPTIGIGNGGSQPGPREDAWTKAMRVKAGGRR